MKNILIIEDDELLSKVLFDSFTKAGFNTTKTVDALQGQQAVFSLKPDLLVLDLMLPAGNGVVLLRNLRASAQTQSIPIIVMTSYHDEEVRKEMEEVGVHGYFHKPFEPDEMIQKINTILG